MATLTVTPTQTFVSGNTVTPATLNQLAQSTVALTAGTIVAADIASDAVTTAKILDAAVTNAKIASGVDASKLTTGTLPSDRIGSSAITTARINDSAVTPAKLSQPYTLATAKAFNWNGSSSNALIDFESIPTWAKRITVMFNEVSTSGVSLPIIQIGDSGGFETSGYTGGAVIIGTGAASSSLTSGFLVYDNSASATNTLSGSAVLSNIAGSSWAVIGMFGDGVNAHISAVAGTKSLSATLTQVRITTVGGSDTFDAGTINISYEG